MAQQYDSSYFMRILLGLCTVAKIFAFQSQQSFHRATLSQTRLNVAVDPSTVTKKELDDIVGADFEKDALYKRLQTNEFLYPKHVEVIEDIGPIANAMVDEIVSGKQLMKNTVMALVSRDVNGCQGILWCRFFSDRSVSVIVCHFSAT